MPGRGPAPKDKEKRQRRNAEASETLVAPDARPDHAPELPDADDLSPETRRWYDTWATSPQATLFVATDWQRLHMLARLVEDYFRSADPRLLGEIRLNEERLGATVGDRQRLRVKVAIDAPGETSSPKAGNRRARQDPRLSVVR